MTATARLWPIIALAGSLIQACEPETNVEACRIRGVNVRSEDIVRACDARLATSGLTVRERAVVLFLRGSYGLSVDKDRALADLDLAMRLDPGHIETYLVRARYYAKVGDRARAAADYDRAIRVEPDRAGSYLERAAFYAEAGDHDRATADYDAAIRLKPSGLAYVERAKVLFAKGEHARAFDDFDAGIRMEPKFGRLFNARADAYMATGQVERAIADYKEAIRNHWYPYRSLCIALAIAERPDEAKTTCDMHMDYFLTGRGIVQLKAGRLDGAIADFDAALELDARKERGLSGRGLARYGRGLALQRKGDSTRAKVDIAAAANEWRAYAGEDVAKRMAMYGVLP